MADHRQPAQQVPGYGARSVAIDTVRRASLIPSEPGRHGSPEFTLPPSPQVVDRLVGQTDLPRGDVAGGRVAGRAHGRIQIERAGPIFILRQRHEGFDETFRNVERTEAGVIVGGEELGRLIKRLAFDEALQKLAALRN